jgi:hypothetical protein
MDAQAREIDPIFDTVPYISGKKIVIIDLDLTAVNGIRASANG